MSQSHHHHHHHRKKTKKKVIITIAVILLVIAIPLTAGLITVNHYLSKMNYEEETKDVNPEFTENLSDPNADKDISENIDDPRMWYNDNIINILLIGRDHSRFDKQAQQRHQARLTFASNLCLYPRSRQRPTQCGARLRRIEAAYRHDRAELQDKNRPLCEHRFQRLHQSH